MVFLRLMVLVFVIWMTWRMVKVGAREADTLKLLLLASLVLNVMAFVFSTAPIDLGSARYLPTLIIFGPLLAGLCWDEAGARAAQLWIAMPIVAAGFLIPFGRHILQPIPEPPSEVIKFLQANQLSEGYGSYWTADILTVLSDGRLKVRQVAIGPEGKLLPFEWQSSRQWYEMKDARFLIFKDDAYGVNSTTAVATWGLPNDRTEIDGYTILSWKTPLHLAQGVAIPHRVRYSP